MGTYETEMMLRLVKGGYYDGKFADVNQLLRLHKTKFGVESAEKQYSNIFEIKWGELSFAVWKDHTGRLQGMVQTQVPFISLTPAGVKAAKKLKRDRMVTRIKQYRVIQIVAPHIPKVIAAVIAVVVKIFV